MSHAGAQRSTRGRGILLRRTGYPHEAGRLSHTLDHGTPFGGWQGCEVPEVLPSSVCEFVRIFPSQAISPDLS